MKKENPKRIVIVGLPGSGKSTFAAKLGLALGIAVHHLDKYMFVQDWKRRDRQEFLSIQKAMIAENSWVIEGCSLSTLEMRFSRADVVIYFHLSRFLCAWRVFKRFIYDKTISDIPDGCQKNVNWGVLKYLWNFDKEKGKVIMELAQKYPHVDFRIFKSSKEANDYIEKLG